jgi:hypothetical protein
MSENQKSIKCQDYCSVTHLAHVQVKSVLIFFDSRTWQKFPVALLQGKYNFIGVYKRTAVGRQLLSTVRFLLH